MTPLVTISVVSHGHGRLLRDLLDDLSALSSRANFEVIVTLNKPDERLDASEYPGLRIGVRRNLQLKGFGENHNAAFEQCASPWFAIVNPDIRLPRDPFPELLNVADSNEQVALVAPSVRAPDGNLEDSVRENLTLWSLLKRASGRRTALEPRKDAVAGHPFFWVAGMFVCVRSAAFRSVGGFDTRFFLYCEDYDLCARLYARGFAIRLKRDVGVIHAAQRDSHRSWRHLRLHLASLFKVWTSAAFWTVVSRRANGPRTAFDN